MLSTKCFSEDLNARQQTKRTILPKGGFVPPVEGLRRRWRALSGGSSASRQSSTSTVDSPSRRQPAGMPCTFWSCQPPPRSPTVQTRSPHSLSFFLHISVCVCVSTSYWFCFSVETRTAPLSLLSCRRIISVCPANPHEEPPWVKDPFFDPLGREGKGLHSALCPSIHQRGRLQPSEMVNLLPALPSISKTHCTQK